MLGHASLAPLVDGRGERLLGDFLGQVEVTGEANQGRDDAAPLGAVESVDGRSGIHRQIRS